VDLVWNQWLARGKPHVLGGTLSVASRGYWPMAGEWSGSTREAPIFSSRPGHSSGVTEGAPNKFLAPNATKFGPISFQRTSSLLGRTIFN
jgi:hypothetical protein